VRDLTPLAGLKKLEVLDVRTSKLRDISPIMDLPNLKDVDLRHLRLSKSQRDAFKAKHPKIDLLF
jgi:Leucine-rich repeat (LRR) protein